MKSKFFYSDIDKPTPYIGLRRVEDFLYFKV